MTDQIHEKGCLVAASYATLDFLEPRDTVRATPVGTWSPVG